jgi:hypothetical protein
MKVKGKTMGTSEGTTAGPTAPENSLPELYTWEETAAYLGVRSDDLAALLPNIFHAVNDQPFLGFTPADVGALEQLIGRIHQLAAESEYRDL